MVYAKKLISCKALEITREMLSIISHEKSIDETMEYVSIK